MVYIKILIRVLLLSSVLSSIVFSSICAAQDWELAREADERGDVSVYVRDIEGNPLDAFKGIVELPYDMLSVLAVLSDLDRFDQWVYQCDSASRQSDWAMSSVHVKIKGIWPVSARDVVTHSEMTQDSETLALTLHTVNDNELLEAQDNFVRIPALDNQFILTPMEKGWTKVEFITAVDPGGAIPKWLANMVAIRAPVTTLENMQTQLETGDYDNTTLNDLSGFMAGKAINLPVY